MIIVIICLVCFNMSNAQTTKTMDSLSMKYQQVLDTGKDMFGSTRLYDLQIDRMLNVVYNRLLHTCNLNQRQNLKTEEQNWIKKRDAYFRRTMNKMLRTSRRESSIARDEDMMRLNDNSEFVKKRVLFLLKRTNNNYSF